MDATTLTALVVAADRDDRDRPLDGPWATEAPRRAGSGRRRVWQARVTLAAGLVALAARLAPSAPPAGADSGRLPAAP